jgi:hypothetical protein
MTSPFFYVIFQIKIYVIERGLLMKMKRKKNLILNRLIYLGIIALFIFVVYLVVFNLVNITMDTPQYISKLAMTAANIKNQIVDNSVFYGFLLLLLVSFLIPAYMKYKR